MSDLQPDPPGSETQSNAERQPENAGAADAAARHAERASVGRGGSDGGETTQPDSPPAGHDGD